MSRLDEDAADRAAKHAQSGPRFWNHASGNGSGATGRHIELTAASGIRSERVRWLWRDRIPLRGLSVIAGEKGLGKSTLTNADLVAKLTCGTLDGELHGQPIDVLIATAEDDWRSVVKPRLMAHDADLERVHRVTVLDEKGESLLTFPDDVPLLEGEIRRLRDAGRVVGLLVIDPIGAFLDTRTDSHKDASVRRALAPLAALADHLDLAVGVVAHLTKDESKRLIARVSGAGAFVNAARSVLGFARDPGDPKGEQGNERVLVHVATNWGRYAPSLAMRIESRIVKTDDGFDADVGHLVIVGETTVGVDDLQRGPDENGSDCEEAIGAALVGGARPSREVKAEITKALECSRRTVERAAIHMADIGELTITSGGFPRTTMWGLCSGDNTPSPSSDTDDPAVATFPRAWSVATDSSDVAAGKTAPSSDSRDTSYTGVATDGSDPAAEGCDPPGGSTCAGCGALLASVGGQLVCVGCESGGAA